MGGDVRCTHNSLVDVFDGTVHFSGGQARNIHHHVGVVFTGTFWCCVVDTRYGTLRTTDSFVVGVGTTDQTRSCHHTHQPTIAGTKRCGISWTHSCCISNTTDDSFLLNILTLGYCIGVVVVVMDGVVVVPRSVPIVERLMGVSRSIEFR